nr:MAG TPA: deoxyuridine 5'-triphosphate nucleotidohydrolase [Caudoviricetes sp.]
MSKFKIGDKVRIREDLNEYNFHDIIPEMLKYAGKEFEIIDIRYNAIFGECYVLNDVDYFWYGDALELVNKSEIKILGVDYTTNTLKIEESVSQKVRGFEIVSDEFRKHPNVDIQLPQRNDKRSAGYDLRIPCKMVIPPHSHSELEFTDICAYMQDDEVLKVFVRSSIGCKKGLILANGTGIIDASYYPRNIGIKLYNTTDKEVVLEENERVCQCIFEKYLTTDDDCCMNENRVGGFGSSNK